MKRKTLSTKQFIKNEKIFFTFFSLTLVTGCFYDPPPIGDLRLKVSNRSCEKIYALAAIDTFKTLKLNGNDNFILINPAKEIPVDSTKSLLGISQWENLINSGKDSSIYVLILSESSVEKQGSDYFAINREYIMKYKLKVSDLDSLKWVVSYKGK